MPATSFWKKTNAVAEASIKTALEMSEVELRADWKLKQASRSGSNGSVSKQEILELVKSNLHQMRSESTR